MELPYERVSKAESAENEEFVRTRSRAKECLLLASTYPGGIACNEDPIASLHKNPFGEFHSSEFKREANHQLEFIWNLASSAGLVVDYKELNEWCDQFDDDAGAEHLIYYISSSSRVLKRTIGWLHGELFGVEGLPIPYLLNQSLVSQFFGTETRFEAVAKRPGEGTTELIISQRLIKAADQENPHPSPNQIEKFFADAGFYPVSCTKGTATPRFEMRQEDLALAIVDSHIRNFILTEDGIKPFDVHFEIMNEESIESARLILG